MTDIETQQVVSLLLAAFPSARLDAEAARATAVVYRRMLADLDAGIARAAIERLIATCKWFPTVAEIREACAALTAGPRRAGGEAWGDVRRAISRYGYSREPGRDFAFEDPLVAKAVSALGWGAICSSENEVADRARFIELYDKLARDNRAEVVSGSLPAVRHLREMQAGPTPAPVAQLAAALKERAP